MDREELRKFVGFLKKNEVYDSFRANYAKLRGEDYFYPFKQQTPTPSSGIIAVAFPWCDTKQGEAFWGDIRYKAFKEFRI